MEVPCERLERPVNRDLEHIRSYGSGRNRRARIRRLRGVANRVPQPADRSSESPLSRKQVRRTRVSLKSWEFLVATLFASLTFEGELTHIVDLHELDAALADIF
jgi:hypothetical protein